MRSSRSQVAPDDLVPLPLGADDEVDGLAHGPRSAAAVGHVGEERLEGGMTVGDADGQADALEDRRIHEIVPDEAAVSVREAEAGEDLLVGRELLEDALVDLVHAELLAPSQERLGLS